MKKILIIEDNLQVRENIAEIIELSNYIVLTAENGKLGVEMALKEIPDLIVCDIMMPVLDGYGVYHSLRRHSETEMIPFIFLTAKGEKADFRKGMAMGADDYIVKPFSGEELLHAIEVRLHKSELLQKHYSGPEALNQFLCDVHQSGKIKLSESDHEMVDYAKKLFVYKEGQRPRSVYFVVSGKVKISRKNEDGKAFITGIHGAGDYFGYTSILQDINYREEAQILDDAVIMAIPREDFLLLVFNDPQVSRAFIRIITRNIAEKEDILLNLAYSSLRKKVAYGLIHLHEKDLAEKNLPSPLHLSRENMAQSFGVATESLIRTLSDFKEEQLIHIEGGKVTIANEKKLRDLN